MIVGSVPGALRGPLGMGRRLAALISLAAIVAFLFTAPPAGAVAPDAGSIIGNQASATYDDGTGIKVATSNTVQTTVAQVASFTLTASQNTTAAPGQTVNFPHTLTNTGNGTDTFDLSASDGFGGGFNFTSVTLYADANCDGVPDNATPITGTGALARNGQFCFIAAAVVPGGAAAGTSDQMTVTGEGNAAAAAGGGYTAASAATNTDTVTVTNNANITTTKALSVTSGPSPSTSSITVTLTYTNTGAATATNVMLTDLIGSGATAGMTYVAGSGLWSGSGSALTDAAGGDPISYDFNATTPNTVRAVIGTVSPGQSGTLSFDIDINAGLPPGSATTRNTAYLCYEDNGVPPLVPALCTGAPGDSQPTNTVAYTVLGSFAVDATDVSATPVASSSTDDDGTPNDIVRDASAPPQGSTVVFDNVIVNDGNGTDTFNITLPANTFPAGTSFQLFNSTNSAPLTDSNADAIPDTGPLAAGTATHVFVHVVLPPSATGGPYDVTKRATSVGGGAGVSDDVTDTLTLITTSTVDLTNNTPAGLGSGPYLGGPPSVTNTVNPGVATTFTLFVNNTSASSDNYDLAASTDETFGSFTLPAGWTVSFRQATGGGGAECSSTGAVITNTGSILGLGNRAVCALVSVPAAAPAGTTSIFFRTRSPNTGASDRKHDAVTVNTVNQLTLIPNNVNQVFPGGNVVYQHTLTNTGNVTESAIVFPAATNTDTLSGSGWNHVLYLDDGDGIFNPGPDTVIIPGTTTISALAAGTSVTIWDNVFAPLGATVGTTNVTTITVQSGSSAANASATDSTTVASSDLTLLKEQSEIVCGGGAINGFVTTPLSGANAVPPGGCLIYRVTGTNSGTTALTSLLISDSTPGFTTLETTTPGCAVAVTTSDPAVPAPATGGTAVLDGATGTVTADKASLAPLTNVVLTYCVQIDQ